MADNIVIKKEPADQSNFIAPLLTSAGETANVMNNEQMGVQMNELKPIVIMPMDDKMSPDRKSNLPETNLSQQMCGTVTCKTEPMEYSASSSSLETMSTMKTSCLENVSGQAIHIKGKRE